MHRRRNLSQPKVTESIRSSTRWYANCNVAAMTPVLKKPAVSTPAAVAKTVKKDSSSDSDSSDKKQTKTKPTTPMTKSTPVAKPKQPASSSDSDSDDDAPATKKPAAQSVPVKSTDTAFSRDRSVNIDWNYFSTVEACSSIDDGHKKGTRLFFV